MHQFVNWYNNEHRHSKLNFVTPAQRHAGEDHDILANRELVLKAAKARNPNRWLGDVRNYDPVGPVTLNPDEPENELQSAA